jgi:hypothetical protein
MMERPILMQTEMVQATLLDLKTQTRRNSGLAFINENPDEWRIFDILPLDGKFSVVFISVDYPTVTVTVKCPYGMTEDLLWIRESFLDSEDYCCYDAEEDERFLYKADCSTQDALMFKWQPSIHMPKNAARVWAEITNIRIERLHAITDADAIAEGTPLQVGYSAEDGPMPHFKLLWEDIHGDGSWTRNPWLWVIEYKVISKTGKTNF